MIIIGVPKIWLASSLMFSDLFQNICYILPFASYSIKATLDIHYFNEGETSFFAFAS